MNLKKSCTLQSSRFAALLLMPLSVIVIYATPALAQGAAYSQRTPPRTVTWYADHQQARAQVQLACMDDPGHLVNDPDCVNAQQASVETSLRAARTRVALDPRSPAFWSADPQTRRNKMLMCRQIPTLDYCDAARRSLLIEAGQTR